MCARDESPFTETTCGGDVWTTSLHKLVVQTARCSPRGSGRASGWPKARAAQNGSNMTWRGARLLRRFSRWRFQKNRPQTFPHSEQVRSPCSSARRPERDACYGAHGRHLCGPVGGAETQNKGIEHQHAQNEHCAARRGGDRNGPPPVSLNQTNGVPPARTPERVWNCVFFLDRGRRLHRFQEFSRDIRATDGTGCVVKPLVLVRRLDRLLPLKEKRTCGRRLAFCSQLVLRRLFSLLPLPCSRPLRHRLRAHQSHLRLPALWCPLRPLCPEMRRR